MTKTEGRTSAHWEHSATKSTDTKTEGGRGIRSDLSLISVPFLSAIKQKEVAALRGLGKALLDLLVSWGQVVLCLRETVLALVLSGSVWVGLQRV